MQCTAGGAIVRIGAAEPLRVRQQVRCEPRALRGDVKEQGLERRVGRMFRHVPEPALSIRAGLNEMVQCGTFRSIEHRVLLFSWTQSVDTADVTISGTKSTTIPA